MKINSLKIFLVMLLIIAGVYAVYLKNSTQTNTTATSQSPPSGGQWEPTKIPDQTIAVTAVNGTFSPSDFKLAQYQNTILKINATDQDYSFELKEFDLIADVPKDKITEILLPGKAVGTFNYKCGQNCNGRVTVVDNDADSDYE